MNRAWMIQPEPFVYHENELLSAGEIGAGGRGQAGRFPARRLASHLRSQGFLPTAHFLQRLLERAQKQGIRFDPRSFGREFAQAMHYRQTRPGYNTRIAMMRNLPVLYRPAGENGNRIMLVGLLPEGALPPVQSIRTPGVEGETSDTLVVGRGRNSRGRSISRLPVAANPDTMDMSRTLNPHFHTSLRNALTRFPQLRGHYQDVVLERMGFAPNPSSVDQIVLTPADIRVARQLLRPGGSLRILQSPAAGQSAAGLARAIRRILPPGVRSFTREQFDDNVLITVRY